MLAIIKHSTTTTTTNLFDTTNTTTISVKDTLKVRLAMKVD